MLIQDTNQWQFYTNNSLRAVLDENGKFGIGSRNPTALLHVGSGTKGAGQAEVLGHFTQNGTATIAITDAANNVEGNFFAFLGGVGFGSFTPHDVVFRTGNTDSVFIKASGKVGIGMAFPSAHFQVNGSAKFGKFSTLENDYEFSNPVSQDKGFGIGFHNWGNSYWGIYLPKGFNKLQFINASHVGGNLLDGTPVLELDGSNVIINNQLFVNGLNLTPEQGTWTPIVRTAGDATPAKITYNSVYSITGNHVTLWADISVVTPPTSADILLIYGVPFTGASLMSGGWFSGVVGYYTGINGVIGSINPIIQGGGGNNLRFHVVDNGGITSVPGNALTPNTRLMFTITYLTD